MTNKKQKRIVEKIITKIVVKQVYIDELPDGRMTLENAAKFLGYKIRSLYVHKLDDGMPRFVKLRRTIYYYRDDLEKWIEKNKTSVKK